jgi:cytochrome b pre-mRNA-processing protein 3
MIFPFFRRRAQPDTISTLYGMIVAQARLPCFYRDYGVPDTVNGRFDLIVLHMSLFLRRLAHEPVTIRALGQGVFDQFCWDMEQNMREMGVGDLAVPKEMRGIGAAFYGRSQAYEAALGAADSAALTTALARNVYGQSTSQGAPQTPAAGRLAAYMHEVVGHLALQDGAAVARGELSFPDPAGVLMPRA